MTRRFFYLMGCIGILASCATQQIPLTTTRESAVSSLTREILTTQEGPRSQEMKEKALSEYERFVLSALEIPASRSEAMADAAQRLADLYIDMEPRSDHSKSRALYEKILSLYPVRSRNDAILYQLARGYADERRWNTEKILLERLVKEHPESSFTQEAYFRLAEHFYDEDDPEAAVHAYRQVLRKQDLVFYEKALYKLGWTLFQMKAYTESADSFLFFLNLKGFQVTPGGQAGEMNLTAADLNTVWEVANTVILVFDYMGGSAAVEDYFKTRGDHRYETYVYRRLGDLYMQMGRFKEAADIYEAFINSNPLHEDAPYFQGQVIEAYTGGNFIDLAHEARITLVETYREGGPWFKANAGESKRKARALVQQHREKVRESMYELALYHHARAQSSKKQEDYAVSVSWDQRFLETFPEDPRRNQVQFLLAEIDYDKGAFLQALGNYHRLAYVDTVGTPCDKPCETLRTEAAYGALHALEKTVKGEDGKIRRDDPWVRRWIAESRRFVQTFPADPHIPEVLLNVAQTYYELSEFDPARETTRQILAMNQADEKTRYLAQRLLAEAFLEEEAYSKTEEEIRKTIALIPKGREKDRPLLEKALASSLYKQGEELRNRGKIAEAAQIFVRVSAETPSSSIAPMALYDAGSLYAQDGEMLKAVQTYELLFRKYPDSPYVQTSLLQWGDLLQNQGKYLEAAPVYERVAALPGRDPHILENAAFLAGLMYEKAGDPWNTQRAFLRYRTAFPEGEHVVEALFKAAEAKKLLQDREGTLRLFQEVIALQKKSRNPTPEEMAAAARAQFAVAEEQKARFEEIRLLSPLEKNLAKKKALLKETLEGFTTAARYRISEITTASTQRMGETLEHFRDALLDSERPSNLTPEQLEQYNFLLEEQAYPFEEKAVAAYENNVRRTQETGLYDSWIRQSYAKLARLLPVKYQRVEEGEKFTGGEVNTDVLLQLQDPDLINSAGIYFREQGEFARAESAYQQALHLNPRHPSTLFNLGILYELYLNKPAEAAARYRAYLQAVKTGVDGTGEESDEKEKRYQQVELWIAALEKQIGGTP